jgi:sugar phosphate isomerase/epimerase
VPLDYFRDIRRKFDTAGIILTAYNLSFEGDFTDDEIARGFEMARALGVQVITTSSDVAIAARLDPLAQHHKMTVAFHNHSDPKEYQVVSPDDFDRANHDAVAFLDAHHDRIVSLHIKDRKRNQGEYVPFGQGDTPIAAVLTRLRDRKWNIPAQIEYEYRGQDTVAEVRRSLEFCRRALEAS